MTSLKYEILLLDHNTIFALWQLKMQTVPAQIDLEDALLGIDKMTLTLSNEEKKHDDVTRLWHMRLGHVSGNSMTELSKRGLLDGCLLLSELLSSSIVPNAAVPNAGLPIFAVPNAASPNVSVQNVAVANTTVPNAAIPNVAVPNVAVASVAVPNAAVPNAVVPNAAVPNADEKCVDNVNCANFCGPTCKYYNCDIDFCICHCTA
ncbi:uncharacterized protein LOC128042568 [Gossypium raimondii]|uniref:uncharacterized protein LOC128042568 n=1 Tax=Gossypium raimondii TaxID=29730 RepID=UPI00227D5495|nr:uncharacterized protein LOC128042568 [Gossypium raimondii]